MKSPPSARIVAHASLLAVVFALAACDLEEAVKADDVARPEVRRGPVEREKFALVSKDFAYPRNTVLQDELAHGLTDVTLTIKQDGQSSRGKMTSEVESERTITVLSPNIRRIEITDMTAKTTLQVSDQTPEVTAEATPLVGRTLLQDRDQLRLDGPLPTEAEQKALDAYQASWIGGDALFPAAPVQENETWAVTPETFLKAVFGQDFTKGRGKVELRLSRIMTYDGQRCAEVVVLFDQCEGTLELEDGTERQLEIRGSGKLFRALDWFDTLKAELKGSARIVITKEPRVMEGPGYFELNAFRKVTIPSA